MNKLDEILEFNSLFVKNKEYIPYITTKKPNKKLVILSCMDTRLSELLPKALNLKNGDAKIVTNAGATIMQPFGSTMRSIAVAIYEFQTDDVLVIGHHGCGMNNLNVDQVLEKAINRGVSPHAINTLTGAGINVKKWLYGFESAEESVKKSIDMIMKHPLIPKDIKVHGLIIDPETGQLDLVVNGYDKV